jgi:two-component system response regulator RegX3
VPVVAPLHVLIVGVPPELSARVAELLVRESASVRELPITSSPESTAGEPAHVVLAGAGVARDWLEPSSGAVTRLVVFVEGGTDADVVEWLSAGADDVVVDAGRPQEVVARIRSVARRRGGRRAQAGGGPVDEAELVIDPAKRAVRVRGRALVLSARQFDLLELLVKNQGRVLTRALLVERLWDSDDTFRYLNALQVHIKRLRNSVEENPSRPRLIKTVRGVGYRFDAAASISKGS